MNRPLQKYWDQSEKISIKEFLNDYLQPLLIKLSFEKKEVIIMGDFNIKFLNCNTDKDASDYIDILYSHSFYPTINSPTGIITITKTLIDIIFYHNASNNILSGYVATSISKHLTISTGPWSAHRRSTSLQKRKGHFTVLNQRLLKNI